MLASFLSCSSDTSSKETTFNSLLLVLSIVLSTDVALLSETIMGEDIFTTPV